MKRILTISALTLVAAIPATLGLVGNATFGQSVPVRVPASAILLDDRGDDGAVTPSSVSITRPATTEDHRSDTSGRATSSSDLTRTGDRGVTPTTRTSEPGDDNGGQANTSREPRSDDDLSAGATTTAARSADDNGNSGSGDLSADPSAGSGGGGHNDIKTNTTDTTDIKTNTTDTKTTDTNSTDTKTNSGKHGGKDDGADHS